MIWNTKHDAKSTLLAYNTNIQTAFHWFKSSKAFNNTRNHRTYAQVVKTSDFDHRGNISAKHGTSGPRIVTVNNEKVKPKIVTPSKVSINAKGCTSLKKSSSQIWEKSSRDSPNAQHQGFLANRFNILMDLHDDSSSDRYTDTEGSEGEVQPFIDTIVPLYTQNAHSRAIHGDQKSSNATPQHEHGSKNTDSLPYDIKANHVTVDTLLDGPSLHTNHTKQVATTFVEKTQKHVSRDEEPHSSAHLQQIPLYVWQNKHLSKDHMACIAQNGGDFGYIPLNDLKIYNGPDISWQNIPDILEAHKIIRNSGVPNFLKSRIPVPTQLNPERWYFHLQDYWDQQLPDLINYGFPLDFDRKFKLHPTYHNYTSATQYVEHIDQYLSEELKYGAIYGPFKQLPFPVHISPLMTRPKQNTDKRRTIMDLSWPKGASINSAIHKFKYLDTYFSLSYPSIDHIVHHVKELGPGSLLYKVDISRAFRHLRIDPGDIDLLGILHQDLFLDGSLPFGFRLGSGFFERCSGAIRVIMKKHNHNALLNYIDDLIYIGLPSKIYQSYHFLLSLLKDLGLEVSDSKLVPPSTCVTCLGIQVDTINKTLSIPQEKLQEIKQMCKTWTQKKTVTKQQYQSLLGSLLYITKCIKPARIFLNRMLQVLRSHHN